MEGELIDPFNKKYEKRLLEQIHPLFVAARHQTQQNVNINIGFVIQIAIVLLLVKIDLVEQTVMRSLVPAFLGQEIYASFVLFLLPPMFDYNV